MMLRSTFRDKCSGVAWQKQLRDRYLDEGVPPVPHLDLKRAQVRQISRNLAKQIIMKYEWLGTMSTTSLHYGIFFGHFCAGVTCIAVNSSGVGSKDLHMRFKIDKKYLLLLARGACTHWAPNGANSKLVSWACKLAKKKTGAKIILAYSDSDAGEIGTIYQVCNWIYIGKTASKIQMVSSKMKIISERSVCHWAKNNNIRESDMINELKKHGWSYEKTNPKGQYVYILDKSDNQLKGIVENMKQPYPKRAAACDRDQRSTLVRRFDSDPAAPIRS